MPAATTAPAEAGGETSRTFQSVHSPLTRFDGYASRCSDPDLCMLPLLAIMRVYTMQIFSSGGSLQLQAIAMAAM